MHQPTIPTPAAWHAREEADKRAWLDQWARGLMNPATLTPAEPAPSLAVAA